MSFSDTIEHIPKLSLDEITNLEDLSVRSYNICKVNGLLDIKSITEFYHLNKSFIKLKNCGVNSDRELTKLSIKYISGKNIVNKVLNDFGDIINNLNREHKDLFNSIIALNFSCLSARSRNALGVLLNNNITIKAIYQNNLFHKPFAIRDLQNVGEKSSDEIIRFLELVKDYSIKFHKAKSIEELMDIRNEILLRSRFKSVNIDFDLVHSKSVFILIDKLIKSQYIFPGNNNEIFRNLFNIYQGNKNFSMEDIAVKANLTRERVRQLRNSIFDSLSGKFQFIESFKDDFKEVYNLDNNSSFLNISNEIIFTINNSSKINFSKQFLKYLISFFYKDTHILIGDLSDVLLVNLTKPKGRHVWKDVYLIESSLTINFDFVAFVNDINCRLEDRIYDKYIFNFKSYLSRFLYLINLEDINRLFPICEKIIRDEFDIYLDLDDNIVFERNTIKQVYEYAIDALVLLNKPSKVEEIYNIINQADPSITKSSDALRGSLQRKNIGIIYFGRESTYGLEIWESEKENIKGGTIKNIVREYLSQFEHPIHIKDLTVHILKFRENSNENSIYQNLKIDPYNSFSFFNGRLVGLREKKYSAYFLEQESKKVFKKDWEERYKELKNFISQNSRFPYSEKGTKQENSLYRWFNIQKDKNQKNTLTEDRKKMFEKLLQLKEWYENKR
ncbi:helicase associated domain-containing protein [Sphingobacterium sp. NPDC055346]